MQFFQRFSVLHWLNVNLSHIRSFSTTDQNPIFQNNNFNLWHHRFTTLLLLSRSFQTMLLWKTARVFGLLRNRVGQQSTYFKHDDESQPESQEMPVELVQVAAFVPEVDIPLGEYEWNKWTYGTYDTRWTSMTPDGLFPQPIYLLFIIIYLLISPCTSYSFCIDKSVTTRWVQVSKVARSLCFVQA